MIYYMTGRAWWVGRLPGAATSWQGGQRGQNPRTPLTIKTIITMVIAALPAMTQTLAIHPIDPVNISPAQAQAITNRVRETAARYHPIVDRGQAFQSVLEEHGLRMAGAMGYDTDSLGLTTADQAISGSAGSSNPDHWFVDLSLTDIETGKTLNSKHATVSNYQDLLTISKTVTKALLQGTRIEDDEQVTTTPDDSTPIIIGTDKVIQEIHVYQHSPGTHGKKRFMPCNMCGGTGKMACRTCPSGEQDCPYCSVTSSYKGPETHGMFMTGHWID